MIRKVTKFIWVATWIALLVIFGTGFLAGLNATENYFSEAIALLAFIFVLFFVPLLFLSEAKKAKKTVLGLSHLLEKSEDKRMEAENMKNEAFLMIDELQEGIMIADKDGKILVANSRMERLLGVSKRHMINKSIFDLVSLSKVRKITLPLLNNFEGKHSQEIELRRNLILELNISPLILNKKVVSKLIILRDITQISCAAIAKNQFTSLATHQLKAPLSNTRLSLKMMLDERFGKITQEQRAILEKTYKENESSIKLMDDLIKEAKITEDDQFENSSLFDIQGLVSPIADFYTDEMKRKKISFKFIKPTEKIPKILADQEKIKIVIQNLFDNAVKYTPSKGLIEVGIGAKSGAVEFKIKDSGIGIPENQKEKIFTRFSRAGNVIKAKTSGSGLGLSIAKDVIDKLNGKIWFQSKENEGSTFFFSLPGVKN